MGTRHPVSKPFAGFESHDACVRENQDKEDPDAFCAWLAEQAKDALSDPNAEQVLTELTTEFVSSVDRPAQDSEWLIFKDADTPRQKASEAERPYVFAEPEDVASKAADVDVRAENEDGERQIAYAAVLIPNAVDKQGDVIPPYVVERSAHEYMAEYRKMDSDHDLDDGAGVPVESWILKDEQEFDTPDGNTVTYPEGTWVIGKRFVDDEWERVQAGELTGFSIYGGAQAVEVEDLVDEVKEVNRQAKGVDATGTYTNETMKQALQAALNSDTPHATFVDRVQDGISKAEMPDEDAAMVADMLRESASMLEESMGDGGDDADDEGDDPPETEADGAGYDDESNKNQPDDTNEPMANENGNGDGGGDDAVADGIDELKSMVKGVDDKVDDFDDRLDTVEDEVDALKSAVDGDVDNDRMNTGDVDDDVPENERMKSVAKNAAQEAVAAVAGVDESDDPEVVRKGLREQVGGGDDTYDGDLPQEDYSGVVDDANDTGVSKSEDGGKNGNKRLVGGDD
mgnify:CR=1 FL=1